MNDKRKSLYRETLEKQLALLEEAQKDAAENERFPLAASYSRDILNLAKEIDRLDSENNDKVESPS